MPYYTDYEDDEHTWWDDRSEGSPTHVIIYLSEFNLDEYFEYDDNECQMDDVVRYFLGHPQWDTPRPDAENHLPLLRERIMDRIHVDFHLLKMRGNPRYELLDSL